MSWVTTLRAGPGDWTRVLEAESLFDNALDEAATSAFLSDPRHHLILGYIEGQPAGFVSAVELLHPDKPQAEMFVYELGVAESHRRKGMGRRLMQELLAICRERLCGEMFVLTDGVNEAAEALYTSVGGRKEAVHAMFYWDWRPEVPETSSTHEGGQEA